jgi:hypothetical protein
MTKADLLKLLEPYDPGEEVVFVTFDDGVVVHDEVEVAKDHSTTRTAPDGTKHMPVAIYLVDPGSQGRPGVMGLRREDILPGGWPEPNAPASHGPAVLRNLLVALLETAQAIAAEPDDPMHDVLRTAEDIDSVSADGDDAVLVVTTGGRRFRVSVAEAP